MTGPLNRAYCKGNLDQMDAKLQREIDDLKRSLETERKRTDALEGSLLTVVNTTTNAFKESQTQMKSILEVVRSLTETVGEQGKNISETQRVTKGLCEMFTKLTDHFENQGKRIKELERRATPSESSETDS